MQIKLVFALLGLCLLAPASYAQCTALKVVGSGLTSLNKAISPPSTIITGNNWNGDFIVPPGARYRRYVTRVKTDKNGQYDLKMVLKYNDDRGDVAYEQPARPMGNNDTFTMTGRPRSSKQQPFQVNVLVGGPAVVGNVVTVTVNGCTK